MPTTPEPLQRSHADAARREELLRAARILEVRSRREATGLFAGHFASAFRGGGMVFEESRPYVPGDDVRRMDWNAMARTGQPFVKHYHEERNRTVSILLDASASMAFHSTGRSPAHAGAHVAALLAAVAGRTGDRVGLVTALSGKPVVVPSARGSAHAWRVVETAARAAQLAAGDIGLEGLLPHLERVTRGDAIVFVISDWRLAADWRIDAAGQDCGPVLPSVLRGLGAREDLVSVVIDDPRLSTLPDVGRLRIADPERPERTRLLDTSSPRVRARYVDAARRRERALDRMLHRAGSDVVRLRSDRDPLGVLARFFHERAARLGVAPA